MKDTTTKIQNYSKAKIHIVQIPPLAKPHDIGHRIQANIYNTNLPETIDSRITTINTQTDFDSTPKSDTITTDGYHSTEKGAEIITEQIRKTLQQENENTQPKTTTPPTRKTPKPDNINTKKIDIPTTKIGIVMGKEGRTQRKIERRHNVGLHINHERNPDNTQTITLRGEKQDTEAAMKDLLNIIDTTTDEPQQRKYNTPCRYYEQGNCKKGETCQYYHDNTTQRQQRKRPHSPERNRTSP